VRLWFDHGPQFFFQEKTPSFHPPLFGPKHFSTFPPRFFLFFTPFLAFFSSVISSDFPQEIPLCNPVFVPNSSVPFLCIFFRFFFPLPGHPGGELMALAPPLFSPSGNFFLSCFFWSGLFFPLFLKVFCSSLSRISQTIHHLLPFSPFFSSPNPPLPKHQRMSETASQINPKFE